MKLVTLTGPMPQGAADVLMERKRQIEQEGWSISHDADHNAGELARAGASYALSGALHLATDNTLTMIDPPETWPWDKADWKPKTARQDLVRAAALILAEIDRMDALEAAAKHSALVQP